MKVLLLLQVELEGVGVAAARDSGRGYGRHRRQIESGWGGLLRRDAKIARLDVLHLSVLV